MAVASLGPDADAVPADASGYTRIGSYWATEGVKLTFVREQAGGSGEQIGLPLQAWYTYAQARSIAFGEPFPEQREHRAGSCPDPRTCNAFAHLGGRWPTDGNGDVVLPYRLNLTLPAPDTDQSSERIAEAVLRGGQAWTAANRRTRVAYLGTTTETVGRCRGVVSFVADGAIAGYVELCVDADTGYYVGFDIVLPRAFTWEPCDPANGSPCEGYGPRPFRTVPGAYYNNDLQNIAVHEWGHVFGLGHPPGPASTELTMWPQPDHAGCSENCRYHNTLGLGDIEGLRALYPVAAPVPVIYVP